MLTDEMFQVLEICHVNGCDVLGTDDLVTLTAVMFQYWRSVMLMAAMFQLMMIQSC